MKITKLKRVAEVVTIEYKEGADENIVYTSKQEPGPAFLKAMEALKPYLIKYCEVDKLDKKLIKVTGVNLSFKGESDVMHVIFTGVKMHKNSGGCLTLNTPLKAAEATDDIAQDILEDDCLKAIKNLLAEGKKFAKGSRLQKDMFK